MERTTTRRPHLPLAAIALAVVLAATVVGCGNQVAENAATGTVDLVGKSALESLPAATSALATMAPDAKLLFIQSGNSKEPTQAPVWGFLFGSPSSDKTYIVYVRDGKAMRPSEYGQAGLAKGEWPKVASADAIKIDSKAALDSARSKAGATDKDAYSIALVVHVPAAETTTTTKPMVWYVSFDPASGAASGTVEVDARTGDVTTMDQ